MSKIKQFLVALKKDEDGATMVEYGMLLFLIAIVCLAAITLLGQNLLLVFNQIATAI